MPTYTDPATFSIAHKRIGSVQLMNAAFNNPLAQQDVESGSPWAAGVWHPYDSTEVGDGNDGVHFDASVTGASDPLETPAFAAKYEYMWLFEGVGYNVNTTADTFDIEVYNETAANWISVLTVNPGTANDDDRFYGYVYIPVPRITTSVHRVEFSLRFEALVGTSADIAGSEIAFNSTPFVVGKMRLNNSPTRNWNAGTAALWRRRVSG